MFGKQFLGILICLIFALSLSATTVMGADILFISAMDEAVDPGGTDDVLKVFMEGLGHTVTMFDDGESEADTEAAAAAADMVFISESVSSGQIREEITEIETPMLITECWGWDEMGLTHGGGAGQDVVSTDIEIVSPDHPLAAGLSGTVTVLTDITSDIGTSRFGNGIAGNDATVIATATLTDGQTYDEMHVDGGATSQMFFYPAGIDWAQIKQVLDIQGTPALYIIRNSRVQPDYKAVKPRVSAIAGKTIGSLIRTQGIGDFYRILSLAERDGIDAKVTWIPRDAVADIKPKEPFDPDYMRPLFEYGYQRMLGNQAWVESSAH